MICLPRFGKHFSCDDRTHLELDQISYQRRQSAFKFSNKSPADMFGLVHANEFDNRNIADSPCSLEARCLHKKGKRIEREVNRETVSEQAEPALLREISKLLTLLWTLVFEPKHILKMMNHLMDEDG